MAHNRLCGVEADKYLPEDLWLDILPRLSVQSLFRCRCVCKTWHHIIGTTSFVETHLAYQNSSSNTNKYMFYDRLRYGTALLTTDCESLLDDHTKLSKLYYTPRSLGRNIRIHGICNGLFCLSEVDRFTQHEIIRVHLWNPICRKVKNLPQLVVKNPNYDGYIYTQTGVSFGYHDDDYKVIVVTISDNVGTCTVSVYSLQTNSWKTIRTSCLFDDGSVPIHVITVMSSSFLDSTAYMLMRPYSIICFSLSDETIRVITFPQEFSAEMICGVAMEVYEDTIAVLGSCDRLDSQYLEMWILRRRSSSKSLSSSSSSTWENKFSIKLQHLCKSVLIPLGFLNNGKYIFRTILRAENSCSVVVKLWWWDLEAEEFPKLTEFDQQCCSETQRRELLRDRIHSNCVQSLLLLNENSLDPSVVHTEMESSCSSSSNSSSVFIYNFRKSKLHKDG